MGGTNGRSVDNVPFDNVPHCGQRSDDASERAAFIISEKHGGILCHKHPWLESRNNSETFAPHPPLIGFTFPVACLADRLARWPAANKVNVPVATVIGRKRLNVGPPSNVRPMLFKNASCVLVDLHLPRTLHPGPLKAEIETTDASEQGTESHHIASIDPRTPSGIRTRIPGSAGFCCGPCLAAGCS
jgi:hypothetical protein